MSRARYPTADARQTTFALCKERRRRQLPARRAREAPKKLEGAADLQEEMAEQRSSVPSDPTKTAATQRASPRAERAIEQSAIARAITNKWRVPAIPLRQAGPR